MFSYRQCTYESLSRDSRSRIQHRMRGWSLEVGVGYVPVSDDLYTFYGHGIYVEILI